MNYTEPLTKENFLLYCAKNYDGRYGSSTDDLYNDINRIKYIKKLITRYETSDELKERLILNHIIVLYNVFGAEACTRILYFKLNEHFAIIKPFLVKIGILPQLIYNIDGVNMINTDLIPMDNKVIEALRKI
jgi:hypothetical protein